MQTAKIYTIGRKKVKDADAVMSVIRDELHRYDYKAAAEHVGVSRSCILAVKSGRTVWPRPKTFFGLIDFLDLRLEVYKDW